MYGSTAARVREAKELHPENYCTDKRCLWRTVTRDGIKPCPNHQKETTMAKRKSTEYTVNWQVQVDATSSLEAAQNAFAMMQRPGTTATVFDVTDSEGNEVQIDLDEVKSAKTAKQLLSEVQALLKERKFTGNSPAVRRRQRTEETLALAVAVTMLDAGYLLGVNDGEEVTLKWSRDIKAVQKALFTTDEDYLFIYQDADQGDPLNVDERPDYWVRFVYGNDGWDVISDYSSVDDFDKYLGDGTAIAELQRMAEEGNI